MACTASPKQMRTDRSQTLYFDAILTRARTAGPDANHAGHEQIASGLLRTAAGRAAGRFEFTCAWTRILAGGDALERCSGSGRTTDGELDLAGHARKSDMTHAWTITGGTGAYRGAIGTSLVRDLSDRETLITVTITPRNGAALHVGVISRPAANTTFLTHANHLCARAAGQLAALPPFPFQRFDPLHPDPGLLPKVGAFFTGPGDPRPTLRTLRAQLALGAPAANRQAWNRTLHARTAALAVIEQQDNAALASNVPGFVNSVRESSNAFRQIAITATVFGATQCVL
jgi:hypothetical protein